MQTHVTTIDIVNILFGNQQSNDTKEVSLKDKGFVIQVNDFDMYFKALIQKFKDLGLTFTKQYYYTGDYMVVGAEGGKDVLRTDEKPEGDYKLYKLATEYRKIEKALEEYARPTTPAGNSTLYIGTIDTDESIIDYAVLQTKKEKPAPKKVSPSIFFGETFVKIGYTLCPIFTCPLIGKFITHEGNTYRVVKGWCGAKSLQLIS